MKKILLILLALLFCQRGYASVVTSIPQNTLKIAQEQEIKKILEDPKSELVRVGIGDGAFKNYDYSEINVFGTSNVTIYDGDSPITTVLPNEIVKVKMQSNMFVILQNNEIIDQVQGPVRFVSQDGLLGVSGLKRAGSQALYRGYFELVTCNKKIGRFHVVNVLEVEDYLKGVVPNEMPVRFGLEALKAQSVAARNYVLSPRVKAHSAFDVVDSVASQVYFGANTEKPLANKAVEETNGVVALHNWNLILAQYSSTAGGYSENFSNVFSDPVTKQFPSTPKSYLLARPDNFEQVPLDNEFAASKFYKSTPESFDMKSPYYRWQRVWTKDELQKVLQQNLPIQSATGFVEPAFKKTDRLDDLKELRVVKRGESGKIIELDIVTKTQTYKVYKELVVRRLLTNQGKALPSANVVFENEFDLKGNLVSVKGFGGGFGHGVGMSQFGAGFMATELKMTYEKILQHYYSGIVLGTKPVVLSGSDNLINQVFYTKSKNVSLVIDNKYGVSHILVNINGKEQMIDLLNSSRISKTDISRFIKSGKNNIIFIFPEDENKNKGLRLYVELVEKDG